MIINKTGQLANRPIKPKDTLNTGVLKVSIIEQSRVSTSDAPGTMRGRAVVVFLSDTAAWEDYLPYLVILFMREVAR